MSADRKDDNITFVSVIRYDEIATLQYGMLLYNKYINWLFLTATYPSIPWNFIIDNNEINQRILCIHSSLRIHDCIIDISGYRISHFLAWLIKSFEICLLVSISNQSSNQIIVSFLMNAKMVYLLRKILISMRINWMILWK